MTAGKLFRTYLDTLKQLYGSSEAANIAHWVFESMAGISRSELIRNPDLPIPENQLLVLQKALDALRQHEPVQYVTGESWFYKLKFKVNKAVLIPRPETEELVSVALNFLSNNPVAAVLDIGTGSGCIPISLKKNSPALQLTAMDICQEALKVAEANAALNEAPVHFIQTDFLNEDRWETFEQFDLIISNPPYIPWSEKETMDKNVTAFEPAQALFVPNDQPVIFYEKIARFGKNHLKPNGKILVEIHENFANAVGMVFSNNGYEYSIMKDMYGKERMMMASLYHSPLPK
ncbi:MAG: peptide chain release factor N(5)-glutamine methyltransferase [Ferruginibacter sp.]